MYESSLRVGSVRWRVHAGHDVIVFGVPHVRQLRDLRPCHGRLVRRRGSGLRKRRLHVFESAAPLRRNLRRQRHQRMWRQLLYVRVWSRLLRERMRMRQQRGMPCAAGLQHDHPHVLGGVRWSEHALQRRMLQRRYLRIRDGQYRVRLRWC